MMDAGIPDPAKLMRLAQQYAASVAGMLLTTLANNPSGNRRVFFFPGCTPRVQLRANSFVDTVVARCTRQHVVRGRR